MADIEWVEMTSFDSHEFLGDALRKALIADLVDYSNVLAYDPDKVDYVIDDVVKHNDGFYYKALKNSPTKEPGCNTDWGLADKFTTACYNTLWCKYGLAEYLSRKLLLRSMPNTIMKLTGKGLVQDRGQDFVHVAESDRDWWLNDQKHKIKDCLIYIEKYVTDVNPACFAAVFEAEEDEELTVEVKGCSTNKETLGKIKKGPWNFL